jgi:hypothetical protein
MNKLVSYKEGISDNALVIWDSRIFRGIGTYVFIDKHYIEANHFSEVMNSQDKIQGAYQPIETYFIECADDDCGWGTVKDQPNFNQSMEQILDFFEKNSKLVEHIDGTGGLSYSYNIYKASFQLKQGTLAVADSTHVFWLNPVGYDEDILSIFDNYKTNNLGEKIIDKIAHLIFYLSVFIAILSIFIVVYIFIKDTEKD